MTTEAKDTPLDELKEGLRNLEEARDETTVRHENQMFFLNEALKAGSEVDTRIETMGSEIERLQEQVKQLT